jgi:hypothetical protein
MADQPKYSFMKKSFVALTALFVLAASAAFAGECKDKKCCAEKSECCKKDKCDDSKGDKPAPAPEKKS